jgi:hypothetical protein
MFRFLHEFCLQLKPNSSVCFRGSVYICKVKNNCKFFRSYARKTTKIIVYQCTVSTNVSSGWRCTFGKKLQWLQCFYIGVCMGFIDGSTFRDEKLSDHCR